MDWLSWFGQIFGYVAFLVLTIASAYLGRSVCFLQSDLNRMVDRITHLQARLRYLETLQDAVCKPLRHGVTGYAEALQRHGDWNRRWMAAAPVQVEEEAQADDVW